jgi:hypothetical protein
MVSAPARPDIGTLVERNIVRGERVWEQESWVSVRGVRDVVQGKERREKTEQWFGFVHQIRWFGTKCWLWVIWAIGSPDDLPARVRPVLCKYKFLASPQQDVISAENVNYVVGVDELPHLKAFYDWDLGIVSV